MGLIFLILFAVLQAADIWTTYKALGIGKREANPILAKLFEKYSPVLTMIIIKSAAIAALWWANMPIVTALCCAVYAYVVAHNMRVIRG